MSEKQLQVDIARLQAKLTAMREGGAGHSQQAEQVAEDLGERRADLRRMRQPRPEAG